MHLIYTEATETTGVLFVFYKHQGQTTTWSTRMWNVSGKPVEKKKWKPDSQDQTPQNGSLVLFGFQFDSNELIQLLNYNFIVSKQTCKHYTSFLNQKSPFTFGQSIKFNPDQQWCILGNWDSTHSWICNNTFLLKRSEHTPVLDRLHRTADFLAVRQAR